MPLMLMTLRGEATGRSFDALWEDGEETDRTWRTCLREQDGRTDERMDGRTNERRAEGGRGGWRCGVGEG